MIPDGDRRHSAVSRDVVGQIEGSVEGHQDIVRILILRDDLFDPADWPLSKPPLKHMVERGVGA